MNQNIKIHIEQVGNGFIVMPQAHENSYTENSEIRVFQSMSELVGFIQGHFTHRSAEIIGDAL